MEPDPRRIRFEQMACAVLLCLFWAGVIALVASCVSVWPVDVIGGGR